MPLDPELFKQLIESFTTELEEHLLAITNGLLTLEKNNLSSDEYKKTLAVIFRSAHNIKGTAFSLEINTVGEIAHSIESLFAEIQKNDKLITPENIDICLASVDKIRNAYTSFLNKKDHLIEDNQLPNQTYHEIHEFDSVRVPVQNIEKISSLLEQIQINKIAMSEYSFELSQLMTQTKQFEYAWKQIIFLMQDQLSKGSSENLRRLYSTANDLFIDIAKSMDRIHKNIRMCVNDQSILIHSIQDEVAHLQMVSVGHLFYTFPRYVRDLSHELNKHVELIIKGEDVKIDKAVLEGLKDPIIHLLRNAIDHGIESENIRKEQGKPAIGHIVIETTEEQSLIKISITDDGAGIDIKKIAEIAQSKKIIDKTELDRMTDNEKLNLIFRSGFSTKDIITDVSGRGVGLDIVKSNIESLNGQITISSIPGKQTTFTLIVPLSIASERGLLIKSGGQQFVVPTISVQRVLLLYSENIIHVQGSQAIIFEEETLPFRVLSDILELKNYTLQNEKKLFAMVIRKDSQKVAFLVDEIIGEKEIVIKTLHEPLPKIPCVSGGTLLENNQVILVLNPADLLIRAIQQIPKSFSISKENPQEVKKKHILVVDDSITTRTLEKNVLESKNYQVTVAVNGQEAWDILQKQSFSLLITDVMMPIMDGFALTEHVKKSERLRNLPVIIVTSLGSDAEKKRGIDVGADAYIVKNEFESGALLNIVSQLL